MADRKHRGAMTMVWIATRHEGVQALDAMDASFAHQPLERPVNRHRRAKPIRMHGLKI